VITARADGEWLSCWYGPCTHTSARLTTKGRFSQTYGRFEARIKIPRGQGVWPAFWLLGENIDEVGFPECGEIDVMENVGSSPREVLSALHAPKLNPGHVEVLPGPVADDFHVFAVDWTPQQIAFSVDGRVHFVQERTDVGWRFDLPFHLILNIAVGGNWPGSPDASTEFPQQMVVDWVRVWPPGTAPG
jgi:beta-glucanase (GH16 family)